MPHTLHAIRLICYALATLFFVMGTFEVPAKLNWVSAGLTSLTLTLFF